MNEIDLQKMLITALLAIVIYFLKRFIDTVDDLNDTIKLIKTEFNNLENRIIKLETKSEMKETAKPDS